MSVSRRRLLAGIPLGVGATLTRRLWWDSSPLASTVASAATAPSPVQGFRINVANASVTSVDVGDSVTVTFTVPPSDVVCTFGPTRLVRKDGD